MKPNPETRLGSLLITFAGHLTRWLLLGIGASLRIRIIEGREHLDRLQAEPRPVIVSHWHDRTFIAAHFLYRQLHRKGLDLTLLASQSRDGEIVSRMVKTWGIETVRGSTSRGGLRALRSIHRAIVRRGSSPILVPDGPRGPAYEPKAGALVLAQTSGAPILPLGFAARSCWHLRSWDRLIVPKPFSKIAIAIGEPVEMPTQLDSEALEEARLRLEGILDGVTRRAEQAVGKIFAKDLPPDASVDKGSEA